MKALLGIVVLLVPLVASAQTESCWQAVRDRLDTAALVNTLPQSSDQKPLDAQASECLSQLLQDPATLNRVLKEVTESRDDSSLLSNLHLEFKTFEAQDATGSTSAHLGLAYRYDKSVFTSPIGQECGEACVRALNLRFTAQGNLALESDTNPRDFLEEHLTLGWFRSTGGARRLSPEAQDRYNELTLQAAQVPEGREGDLAAIDKQIAQLLAGHLTNQFAYEFDADVSLESDQRFQQKHWVYAARAAVDFRGWGSLHASSWQSAPTSAKLNVFDYPFALLRRLTGYTKCTAVGNSMGGCFVPLGTSWPTVSVAVGQVQPGSSEPRTQVAGNDSYTRVATEVSFKTPIAKWESQPVYVSANWRRYDELSPPDAVRAANLAYYEYFVATVGPQRGLFASYSSGRLPFDHSDDQVYELGFRTLLD
jgi:hypothetical protein